MQAASIIHEFESAIPKPTYDIILDNTWETDDDKIETLRFLVQLPTPYHLCLFALCLYPGTELYERAKREGVITDDHVEVYRKHSRFAHKTYLNSVYYLLEQYAQNGVSMSPRTMDLLTNKELMRIRMHWLVYLIMQIRIVPFRLRWFGYLAWEGLRDLCKGDWSRIHHFWYSYQRMKN